MSCLSWNCHGIAKPRTVRFLKEIVKQPRPSLIFLSETLVKKIKLKTSVKQYTMQIVLLWMLIKMEKDCLLCGKMREQLQ